MPVLSCPHCGFSKQLAEAQMPRQQVRITCPQCRQPFSYVPIEEPPGDPSLVAVDCPHCGNHRLVPREKIPPGFHELRCRKCGQGFTFNIADHPPGPLPDLVGAATAAAESAVEGPETPAGEPAPEGGLPPVIDLFARSWQLYKRRVWILLVIYLLTTILPSVLIGVGGAVLLPMAAMLGNIGGLYTVLGIGAVVLFVLLVAFGIGSMMFAVVDPELGVGGAITLGWNKVWSYVWLLFLLGLITTGGFLLLVIPGLLFITWFLFAQYLLAEEDERGMNALLKSRAYVGKYFWGVLLRLLVLWVTTGLISYLLGLIPYAGRILQLFVLPFSLIYPYLLLADLKRAHGGTVAFSNDGGSKARWVLAGLAGYIVLPLVFFLADGPARIQGYLLNLTLQRAGAQTQVEPNWEQLVPIEDQIADPLPEPQRVGKQEYLTLLDRGGAGFDTGGISLGPLAIKVDQFWEGSSAPHLWLKIRCLDLPNLRLLGERGLTVTIDRVVGDAGSDQYDPQSTFEKESFRQVALELGEKGQLEGTRDIYLRPGTGEEEIRRIEGQVSLTLPLGVESLELTPSMMGESLRVAGRPVKFVTMRGGMIRLELPHGQAPLLRVIGYNVAGEPLVEGSSSWTENQGSTILTQTFQGELFSVRVLMAGEMLQRRYPFSVASSPRS